VKYERFEDLPVWQAAIGLARRAYDLTEDPAFAESGDLTSNCVEQRSPIRTTLQRASNGERRTTSSCSFTSRADRPER